MPELDNFLRILNKEEDEYVDQIRAKYQLMEIHIQKKLQEMDEDKTRKSQARESVTAAIQQDMCKTPSQSATRQSHQPSLRKLDIGERGRQDRFANKEKSPPADQIDKDEREPIFV